MLIIMEEKDLRRFMSKVKQTDFCWEWLPKRNSRGYGQFSLNGKTDLCHRVSFRHFKGDIINGNQIDHLCRNTSCVNPVHLEQVSKKENLLRGVGISAKNSKKTHCPQGHEYSKENIIKTNNRRVCRECNKIRCKKHYNKL